MKHFLVTGDPDGILEGKIHSHLTQTFFLIITEVGPEPIVIHGVKTPMNGLINA